MPPTKITQLIKPEESRLTGKHISAIAAELLNVKSSHSQQRLIIFDLTNVRNLTGDAQAGLVVLRRKLEAKKDTLALANISPGVYEWLHQRMLDDLLDCKPDATISSVMAADNGSLGR